MRNLVKRVRKLEQRYGLADDMPLCICWMAPLVGYQGPDYDQLLAILDQEGLLPKSGFVGLSPNEIPAGTDEEIRKYVRENPSAAFGGGIGKSPSNTPEEGKINVRANICGSEATKDIPITGRASCYCSGETEESQ